MPRSNRRIRTSVAIALALAFVGGTTVPAHARPRGPLVPRSGALFGAYVDPDNRWAGNSAAMAEVTTFERQLGRALQINQHYYAFGMRFPSGLEEWDLANGRIPLISWEGTRLSDITSGKHDALIRARADGVKALGKRVFIRWAWEMNGNWYAWSGARNGANTTAAARYRAAWRRVVSIFRARGATNAVWVWSPNHANIPARSWNRWQNYYPGHSWVDWVGIDGYNWGRSRSWSRWQDFRAIFGPVYASYRSAKPIMIAETASTDVGGDKARWIRIASFQIKRYYPSIAAVVWFHVNKEEDWRATSSSTVLRSFRAMSRETYFRARAG